MKTLTYSLASTKCMDDGWTVRPLSPIGTESSDHLEPFEIEINSSRAQVNYKLIALIFYLKQSRITFSDFLNENVMFFRDFSRFADFLDIYTFSHF